MAEFDLNALYNLAVSQEAGAWLSLGINLLLSTLVGGIVLLIIFEILSKAWKEEIKVTNVFLLVFFINIINLFGVFKLLNPIIVAIPLGFYVIPALIWIVFSKLFFRNLGGLHAVIVGIIGFVLSIISIPNLVLMAAAFLPAF